MKKITFSIFFILIHLFIHAQDITKYVDPFIGTLGHGHTYPGATMPFGMVQLSPDNGTQGWDWCSGYNYSDDKLAGFSHTHLSGTGIGDLTDISVLPLQGALADTMHYSAILNHNKEKASPGYYEVNYNYKNNSILAKLTAGKFLGFHEYSFIKDENPLLQIDLGWTINWDNTLSSGLQIKNNIVSGYRYSKGWSKDQRVFFAIQFDNDIILNESLVFTDNLKSTITKHDGKKILAFIKLKLKNKKIKFKVGLSFANIEGAMAALKEQDNFDFEKAQLNAKKAWQTELEKVKITSKDESFLKTFYTALYHTCLAPTQFSDILGQYRGIKKDTILKTTNSKYSVHSLWDTFRSANPLLTIWQENRVVDIINSYLDFYQQSGLLPVWDLHYSETNTMTGYHAVPIIADAILKNIKGFDYELAFEAMLKSANQLGRGTPDYIKYNFLPSDKHGWSTTITLEYAFDDWCIAQVAKKLKKVNEFNVFSKRAQSFENLFDKETNFFRARKSDGSWLEPFDPIHSEHGFDGQYIEGTAWQHTWFLPHDITRLIELFGGNKKFVSKLDSLFTMSSKMTGENVSVDISGLIGQYAHGNEPSHHIVYLYSYANNYPKTANTLRKIMNTMYSSKKDGLCGNEDCGQMSAWYVMNALGFYSVNPCGGKYDFGSPLIDRAEIQLANNKKCIIIVTNNSNKNKMIKNIIWNGKPIKNMSITHDMLINGGELKITMGGS